MDHPSDLAPNHVRCAADLATLPDGDPLATFAMNEILDADVWTTGSAASFASVVFALRFAGPHIGRCKYRACLSHRSVGSVPVACYRNTWCLRCPHAAFCTRRITPPTLPLHPERVRACVLCVYVVVRVPPSKLLSSEHRLKHRLTATAECNDVSGGVSLMDGRRSGSCQARNDDSAFWCHAF